MIPVQEGMAPLAFGGFILLLMAGGLLFYWLKRRSKRTLPAPPPHEIALKALAGLRDESIGKGEGLKIYYEGVSRIFREYMLNRFAIRAPEMTTEECLMRIRDNLPLSGEARRLVGDLLKRCDAVKFSNQVPLSDDLVQVMRLAESIIKMTQEPSTP